MSEVISFLALAGNGVLIGLAAYLALVCVAGEEWVFAKLFAAVAAVNALSLVSIGAGL